MTNSSLYARAKARVWCTFALAGAALALPACQTLDDVDARVDRIIRDQSDRVGGRPRPPTRTEDFKPADQAAREGRTNSPALVDKAPPTVNPEAEDLSFTPASEARDFAAKLDEYELEAAGGPDGAAARPITLREVFQISQRSAREYLNAEEEYILSAIRLLIERHLWGPRFFNDTSALISGAGDNGDFQSAVQVVNELRATQRLPYGGNVEAGLVWRATEQLREQATGRYRQSSELILGANIPLLRGAGLVAQESLIQSERNLVYSARTFENFRRSFFVELANDYFRLLQQLSQLRNRERQLEGLIRLEQATTALVESGRLRDFEKQNAANQVLQARANLQNQREAFRLSLDRFKVRLGLPPTEPVALEDLPLELGEPEVSLQQASELALSYRLDLQNRRDQLDDARRGVNNARNNLLPSLDFTGRVITPTDPDAREGGLVLSPEDLNYSAGVTFGLPLDREIERLQLRQSLINLQQRQRDFDQFRDNIVLNVRAAVRAIDLAKFQFRLADEQVKINERRLEGLKLDEASIDRQRIVDAENDLLNSLDNRARALTDLRNSVLNYLLESGQLRVNRDGTFLPLPGMEGAQPPDLTIPPPPTQ